MSEQAPKTSVIYCGDCLDELKRLPDNCIDLVYIDPPFNSNRNYEVFWGDTQQRRAFEDRFGDAKAYCEYMFPRVAEIYRVLKKTGSFYYHCDWHASHYIKVKILDEIFGFNAFQNEIVWKRTSSHNDTKRWAHIHDTILFYAGPKFSWNPIYLEHDKNYVETFYRYKDDRGVYRLDHIIRSASMGPRPNLTYEYKGYTPEWGWRTTRDKLKALDKDDRITWSRTGRPYLKRYLHEQKGVTAPTIWDDILPVQAQASERLGYPTQKPVALLERIVKASSNEGDIVLDPFCGCGTALVAAQKLNRRWIGIDIAPSACRVMGERLERDCGLKRNRDFMIENLPISVKRLRDLPPDEFQEWCVHALSQGIPGSTSVVSPTMSGDMGIDGKLYLVDRLSLKAGAKKVKKLKKGEQVLAFDPLENYIPIQVKQKDKVGRPDIDEFYAAIKRDKRNRGFFAAFGYADTARKECERLWLEEQISIQLVTVKQLIDRDFRKELEYIRMLGGG
ncbi:restriction endonuclease [bacterium]|nr:restriction endonuclease [bacterium]